jgi:ketosteroid isomerase-like protein
MSDDEIRAANRALFEASLASVGHSDLEHCTEDYVLELPYSTPPKRIEGKAAVRAYLAPALTTFNLALTLTQIYDCADPNQLVAEYTSVGTVTTTGKPYENRYIAVVRFRDGLICENREYYNPLPAVAALTPD